MGSSPLKAGWSDINLSYSFTLAGTPRVFMFDASDVKSDGSSANISDSGKRLDGMLSSQLALAHFNLATAYPQQSVKSPGLSALAADLTESVAAAKPEENNGLLHLTGLALTSTVKGFLEPAVGALQIHWRSGNDSF